VCGICFVFTCSYCLVGGEAVEDGFFRGFFEGGFPGFAGCSFADFPGVDGPEVIESIIFR